MSRSSRLRLCPACFEVNYQLRGHLVKVPRSAKSRGDEARELKAQGMKAAQIAAAMGLSVRQVFRYLAVTHSAS